jgi:hypothetical protein
VWDTIPGLKAEREVAVEARKAGDQRRCRLGVDERKESGEEEEYEEDEPQGRPWHLRLHAFPMR